MTPLPTGPNAVLLWDLPNMVHRFLSARGNVPRLVVEQCGKQLRRIKPGYAAAAIDLPWPSWRAKVHPEYKRKRQDNPRPEQEKYPAALQATCELLEDVFGVPTLSASGYEADDLLATAVAHSLSRPVFDLRCVVVSSDKDLLQLVGRDVVVLHPDGRVFRSEDVVAAWGVPPDKLPDVLGIAGDPVDGYPGVPGIGPKGAAELVREWGSLEGALLAAGCATEPPPGEPSWWDGAKRAGLRKKLLEGAQGAQTGKRLAILAIGAPLRPDLFGWAVEPGCWDLQLRTE